ncbi:solute carrier family 35 member F4-like [Dendronephthya gigantea]|uniref:solute carrier family 35 member F4-like n=1 Tax=Dendronephthya gigantea TaxID=151771 RepID=UPI00106B986E|nr:solute carrier family 35 member F4-like [Dendronephthya gigantea]
MRRDFSDNSLVFFNIQVGTSGSKFLRTLCGVGIVIGIAISWVGSTQFAKSTYTSTFNAPWFVVWFSTNWMTLSFPVVSFCYRLANGSSFLNSFGKAESIFGERGLCPYTLLTRCLPFAVLWGACNYMYTRSLSFLSATDVTALFSSTPAFVFVLSLLLLKDEIFSWRRLLATLISIGGIVIIAYSDGFTGPTTTGVLLGVGSAVLAAMYKVTFKIFIGEGDVGQVSLFLTCLGLINLLWFLANIRSYLFYSL